MLKIEMAKGTPTEKCMFSPSMNSTVREERRRKPSQPVPSTKIDLVVRSEPKTGF